MNFFIKLQHLFDKTRCIDFLAPLALRLYLVPIFWIAGTNKLNNIDSVIAWFGNPDSGLGLPYPEIMAYLAAYAETLGAVALLLGLAVRWFSIPLMITMLVAIFKVHLVHGWSAIADSSSVAAERLQGLLQWLQQDYPGRYQYVTELGEPVMLNNGIEFATTYLLMLLALFFMGGGRYLSIDYWLRRKWMKSTG